MDLCVRPAAVAGAFYPDNPSELDGNIQAMLNAASRGTMPPPKAIIAPHAGYIYSGPIAASIYAPLQRLRGKIRRIVLLGPTHRVAINGLAVPTCQAFATPLGDIPVDHAAIATITNLPQVVVSDTAHAEEHSLEVQLPFLIKALGHFSLVPLAVGQATPEAVAEVLERLWNGEETLIVVSSDLSHYLPYDTAWALDGETAQSIVALDPTVSHRQACGATPINGLLHAARHHGLQARLIDLRNSGDTAGDRSRVVGYAAFAFYEPNPEGSPHAH